MFESKNEMTIFTPPSTEQSLVASIKKEIVTLPSCNDPRKIKKLHAHKKQTMQVMQQLYPHLLQRAFSGKIVYTLQAIAPEVMIDRGGFKVRNDCRPWLSDSGSGDNKGCICFSLLPEVSLIFMSNIPPNQKAYLYVFPLQGHFFLPGGNWRQIISPGAFPLTPWWIAREVVEVRGREVRLGTMVGHMGEAALIPGERFHHFKENILFKPRQYEGEASTHFDIVDTPYTAHFQAEVKAHYTKASPICSPPSLAVT